MAKNVLKHTTCDYGHEIVIYETDLDEIQATIGTKKLEPLPDNESYEPIDIACPNCTNEVRKFLKLQH